MDNPRPAPSPPAQNPQRPEAQSPYDILHIYYLEGGISPPDTPDPAYLGTWREGGDSFLFFSRDAGPAVARLLRDHPQVTLVDHYEMSYEQWQGAQPAPMRLGSFQVSPPWMTPAAPEGGPWAATGQGEAPQHVLILDPGMVFGTGTHTTTRDCLEALELACTPRPPATVLDLGTGSGLLALAAAKLGCQRVLAVDNNYLALQTTLANVRRNHLEGRILAVQGSAETFVPGRFELLVANIHFAVMEQILSAWTPTPGQRFILSGLMRSEARTIHDRLSGPGARILRRWEQDGIWHTFYGEII